MASAVVEASRSSRGAEATVWIGPRFSEAMRP